MILCNTSSFLVWSVQLIFSTLLQHDILTFSRYYWLNFPYFRVVNHKFQKDIKISVCEVDCMWFLRQSSINDSSKTQKFRTVGMSSYFFTVHSVYINGRELQTVIYKEAGPIKLILQHRLQVSALPLRPAERIIVLVRLIYWYYIKYHLSVSG
jgi:hypothetical protein